MSPSVSATTSSYKKRCDSMIPLKNRTLTAGQRVQVYYNLHKGGYSIKDKATGLVVGYAQNVLLTHCKFRVQQGGRRKTIQEKRKRVHAYIEGDYQVADTTIDTRIMDKIIYNPYTTEQFTDVSDGSWVMVAPTVFCADKVCYVD